MKRHAACPASCCFHFCSIASQACRKSRTRLEEREMTGGLPGRGRGFAIQWAGRRVKTGRGLLGSVWLPGAV